MVGNAPSGGLEIALDVTGPDANGQQGNLCISIRLAFEELEQNVLHADVRMPESRGGRGALDRSQGTGVDRSGSAPTSRPITAGPAIGRSLPDCRYCVTLVPAAEG